MQLFKLITLLLTTCSLANLQGELHFQGKFYEYEQRRLDLVALYLPENPTIFEAGGHYGTDTVRLSEKWPLGVVHSFEPNPHAFEIWTETTASCTNVHGYNIALNDYTGTAILNVCHGTGGNNPAFEGASSLLKPSPDMEIHYQGPQIEVPCIVLDEWCKENGVDHFDFMWLDLEGLELQVLRSSPEILSTVKVIYTETNFREFRQGMTQYRDLKKFLEENGFELLAHWYQPGLQGDAIFIRK